MTHNPEVSLIMPVYNAGDFIAGAIESVLAQTFQNFELIIINDGSTDKSLEIATYFAEKDARIRIINMDKPSGSAYQPRKIGVEAALSSIVSPIDADDIIEPDYIQKLMRRREETGADIVYPIMYGDKSINPKPITPYESEVIKMVAPGKEFVKLTLDGWRMNCNGGVLDKNLYLKAYSVFDSSIRYSCADELLSRQLLYLSKTTAISDARYFYTVNDSSITRACSPKRFDIMINNRSLIEFTRKYYSEGSVEYCLAQRQNFHGIFSAARLLNKLNFSNESIDYANMQMKLSRQMVDFKLLRKHVSPRYYALLRYNLLPLTFAMKIIDLILRR